MYHLPVLFAETTFLVKTGCKKKKKKKKVPLSNATDSLAAVPFLIGVVSLVEPFPLSDIASVY
jgi:hypothetical protein